MRQMSRRERLQAAINRQPVDRVPYAVWRHFPERGPLLGRPGPGDAPLPRSLRLRLLEDHAPRRLRRGGLGLRGGRGGLPDGHRACARARWRARGLEEHPPARSRDAPGLRPSRSRRSSGWASIAGSATRRCCRRCSRRCRSPTSSRATGSSPTCASIPTRSGALEAITETLISSPSRPHRGRVRHLLLHPGGQPSG